MATKFQIKRTSVTGNVPNTSQIDVGELAINLIDQKLYSTNGTVVFEIGANLSSLSLGNSSVNTTINSTTIDVTNIIVSGNITANGSLGSGGQVLTSNTTGGVYWASPTGGSASVTTQNTAPGSPNDGDLWWDTYTGELKIYYDDGDSQQWVDASSKVGPRGATGAQGPFGPKSVTIGFPTASEDMTLLYTSQVLTISEIASVMKTTGTSNVAFTIRHASTRDAVGTEVVTGGSTCTSNSAADVVTAFNSPIIAANSFIWLETSAINGSVQEFHVSINFS